MKKFEPAHKNTGKNERCFTIGRLMVYWNIAESDDKWWAVTDQDMKGRTTHHFSLCTIERYEEENLNKFFRIILGRFWLSFTLM